MAEHADIDFRTSPEQYRHWRLDVEDCIATVTMAVDPNSTLHDGYELKSNSYDLGVDIELADLVQRLRFEHPEVRVVVLTSDTDKLFCAGANIQMLAASDHGHKVNFCKFTNETRNSIEEATARSGQAWIAAINGTAAGGGYELALACEEILLVDDRSSAVSLPEVPLLAVLPGTGGLTRLVDKRHVRRDLADAFATRAEGVRGETALAWRLVDHLAPPSRFATLVGSRAAALAAASDRPDTPGGMQLIPIERTLAADHLTYSTVRVELDRASGTAAFTVAAPDLAEPSTPEELLATGAGAWLVRCARELDDAVLHLRANEAEIGTWTFRTIGNGEAVTATEQVLARHPDHWLVREVRLLWGRVLKRLDVSSRTLIALVEPGSCFSGLLAELLLVADRSFMLSGTWEDDEDPPPPATITLGEANLGRFPMANGLSRLHSRFWGRDDAYEAARATVGRALAAAEAAAAELVTFTPDDLDWHDEVRLALEERNSFSPDALTAMEANYRFVGPETMETKIFARLTAWQNWIFQRPNAVGPEGALRRFGTGTRASFDHRRV